MWPKDYLDNLVMLHWFQSCSTDFSYAPLISVMLHWLQSCSTDFSYAPLTSVMLHWLQSCSTDFSYAPLTSVMLHWFQSCSTDFSHAPLTSVMLHWFQSCSTDFSHAPLTSVMLHWLHISNEILYTSMEENCYYTKNILYSSHANLHSKLRCDTRKIIPCELQKKCLICFFTLLQT